MKILKVVDLGYESGGTEIGVTELKKELEKRGHTVKILASDIYKGEKSERFNDFEFKSIKSNHLLKFVYNLFNPYSYFKFKRILNEYKPDVVHLHTMEHSSPSILFLLKKIPTVLTVHGPEVFMKSLSLWTLLPAHFKNGEFEYKNSNRIGKLHYFYHTYIQRYIYKVGLKNVDLFIGISNFITELTDKEYSPVIKIDNFIKLLKYKKVERNFNLLFLGRVEKVKGVEQLIKALPEIINKFPQTKLTVVGTGGYYKELQSLIKSLNLKKYVTLVGKIDHSKIEKFYHNSSIVIFPSIWPEAFGKVGVEAMSTGRPVIATNVGGIPQWVDNGKTGFLISPNNSAEIAEKTIKLFSNESLLKKFGTQARIKSKNYTVEKHVTELEKAYKFAIKNNNS